MCARFTLRVESAAQLLLQLGVDSSPPAESRFNVAPTQGVAVVTNDVPRRLSMLRFGLVPSFAKDTKGRVLVNARVESAHVAAPFRDAFARHRCVVLADGWYEWQVVAGQKKRVPWHVQRAAGEPFVFAAIWAPWRSPDGTWLRSCAILTTDAEGPLRAIHDRMPVVLDPGRVDAWLDPGTPPVPALRAALSRGPGDFVARRVSTHVNAAAHDDARCLEAPAPDETYA